MMNKLKEIYPGGSEISDWSGLTFRKTPDRQTKKDLLKPSKVFKYKGYRFLNNARTWCMYLPDRPFLVGAISYYMDSFQKISERYPEVSGSAIHRRFRGQGLGVIMYKAMAKYFDIIASDSSLMDGSFRVWSHSLPEVGGYCGIYDYDTHKYYILYSIDNLELIREYDIQLYNKITNASRFFYFNKKSLIPKGSEVIDKPSKYKINKFKQEIKKQYDFIKDAGYNLNKVGTKLTHNNTKEYTLLDWIRLSNLHKSNQDNYHYDDELRNYNIIDTAKDYTLVYDRAVIKNSSFIYLIYNPKQYTKPYEVVETFKTHYSIQRINDYLTRVSDII